ncbi:MAG TPA: capsular biosynthesis protein, partial [Clostridiales bacterium]|nr:capsular biosynthesis protein [Clostridiales bacterium]
DLVIVSFHWGSELQYYPDGVQVELGHVAIDAGADLVWGHHPHVIQGIEKYKDRYIVYSLGNFCFGGNINPSDKDTMIFQARFSFTSGEKPSCTGNIVPCRISSVDYINDYKPVVLTGEEERRVIGRIHAYSAELPYGIVTK